MRSISVVLVFLALSACSSIPEVFYYLLPEKSLSPTAISIKIVRIEINDYIDHDDVVLELKDGSIHRANFHKWGEPLEMGIRRILEGGSETNGSLMPIELIIRRFHGTEEGDVRLLGKWRLADDSSDSEWNDFGIEKRTRSAGYVSMLEVQAQAVVDLHDAIVEGAP
jgi:uncharacterized lipoprotein YmbA